MLTYARDDAAGYARALGAGRMLRAPTVFEDVKTICTSKQPFAVKSLRQPVLD